ncbi:MAG: hypothetical protein ACYDHW_07675 [Syntrophorhabdaceae bacterium]
MKLRTKDILATRIRMSNFHFLRMIQAWRGQLEHYVMLNHTRVFLYLVISLAAIFTGYTDCKGEAVYIIPPVNSSSSKVEMKSQTIVWSGEWIKKPECTTGNPRIYVYPVYVTGLNPYNSYIYSITGFSAYAVDGTISGNNGYWLIVGEVKNELDQLTTAYSMRLLAQTWCCANDDCS